MKPSEKLWILSQISDFFMFLQGVVLSQLQLSMRAFSYILKARKPKLKSQNQNRAMGIRTGSHRTLSDSVSSSDAKPHS